MSATIAAPQAREARHSGCIEESGDRFLPQERVAFNLVAALYANVPLRKFRGATCWQDGGSLDRRAFNDDSILWLATQMDEMNWVMH